MAEFVDNFSDLKELGIGYENDIDVKFGEAADHLTKLVSTLDNQTLLDLYAYYKQGKEGPCTASQPSWFDFKGRSKWEAWKNLGDMPQDKAKTLYIDTIKTIDPNFGNCEVKEKESWVCVSTLQGDRNSSTDGVKTIVDHVKENNREEVLTFLKDSNVDQMNRLDENGLSLIHWAADIGSVEIICDLLSYGADINSKDSDGQTALHYAANCGHLKCVDLLLGKGAKVDVRDNEGLLPIDVSIDKNIEELLNRDLSS